MKKLFLILLMGCCFTTGITQSCDIALTGIGITNAVNTAPVPSVALGGNVNFKFVLANFGTNVNCTIPANSVSATFEFPTLSNGTRPYVYDGPASFVSGYFTWNYSAADNQLKGVNTIAIPNGTGDPLILVKVKGVSAGEANAVLRLVQNGNLGDNLNNNVSSANLKVAGGSLPIKLSSFTGTPDKCDAVLSWTTAMETASFDHFAIEYSPDALTYIKIGIVKGKNSATGAAYNFKYSQLSGSGYYRLRQVDKDKKEEISSVVRVMTECLYKSKVLVYPNPVQYTQKLSVSLSGYTGQISGELMNVAGQRIASYRLVNGLNQLMLKDLSDGTYTLQVRGNGNEETFKVIVIR